MTSSRPMILLLGLGVLAMLGASLSYRFGDHPLVKQAAAPQASAPAVAEAETAPKDPMAAMRERMSDPEQAATVALMQKLQANPNDPDALLDLADLLLSRGDVERAENFMNRAAVAAPSDARPAFYLGVLRERQGRYQEAAELLKRSLSLENNPSARFSLAVLYLYHLNAPDKARAELEAALASPEAGEDLKNLARRELDQLQSAPKTPEQNAAGQNAPGQNATGQNASQGAS